jgi:regulator of nucleoside diphosphate kinase
MSKDSCILTTKDFTILEVMRDRCLDPGAPLARVLDQKIQNAVVVFRDDVPPAVATLSSRVTYRVNDNDPDTRQLSAERMGPAVGIFLPISTLRGLSLLGLTEGQTFKLTMGDQTFESIKLERVHYQPEAARRTKLVPQIPAATSFKRPMLKVIQGSTQKSSTPSVPGLSIKWGDQ